MFFFQPWMFWLGLTLPAILALYILRPRRRQTVIPSTMLWHPVSAELEASRPWQRLQSRLLLWLQLLAAALLVLAATGPVWFAPASFRSTIVLLDTSASMRALEDGSTRFQSARDEVISIASGLRGDATITVISFDRQPRVVVRDASNSGEVRRALEEVTPSASAAEPAQAVSLARAMARQYDNPRLVLVSDGGLSLSETDSAFEFIPVGQGDASVSIAAVNLRPAGTGYAAQVALVNHGSRPASGRVSLFTGSYPAGSKGWELAPGESRYLQWQDLPGGVAIRAELSTDSPLMDMLVDDNVAWAVPDDNAERKVLLVTGGNLFLERVLGQMPGTKVYLADQTLYQILLMGEYPYDITVLDGLGGPLPPGAALLINPPAGLPTPGLTIGELVENIRPTPVSGSPVMQYVDLAEVNFQDARKLQTEAGWNADIRAGNEVIFAHGETEGRRAAVWAVNLHRSDLPLRPAFPVLVQNTIDWLYPPGLGMPRAVKPGDEVKFVTPPLAGQLVVEDDSGGSWKLAPPFPPDAWVPEEPGLYQIMATREGGTVIQSLAVNGYSAAEAELTVRNPFSSSETEANEDEDGAGEKPRRALPLVQWLAMAALLVITVEWGVASRGR